MTPASFLCRRAPHAVASCVLLLACDSGSSSKGTPSAQANAPAAAPSAPKAKPEFVSRPADGTPLAAFVQNEVQRGRSEQRRVLVYVGARWCEPCQRFHAAVQSGELDAELAGLRFVEFDLDRDGAELEQAGYGSRLIPLLALPKADGTSGRLRLEGSIKGPTAVQSDLLPRLNALLARAAQAPE